MQPVTVAAQPSPQAIAARDRSERRKVTGRLKRALDAMAWEGKTDNEAAVSAGMNVLSIRLALNKQHVRAYYQAQLQVLRTRESARNIFALVEVRDQKTNQMARVQAVKALEQLADDPVTGRAAHQVAGFVIQVITNTAPGSAHMGHVRSPDAKPLITLDSGSERDPEHGK